jgi:hypothetical protein
MMNIQLFAANDERLTSEHRKQYQLHPRGFWYEVHRQDYWAYVEPEECRPYLATPLCHQWCSNSANEWPAGEGFTPEQAVEALVKTLEGASAIQVQRKQAAE